MSGHIAFTRVDKLHVLNGTVWESSWPDCQVYTVQYVDGDRWMLLSQPEKGVCGNNVMIPRHTHNCKCMFTREELASYFNEVKAIRLKQQLALVPLEEPFQTTDPFDEEIED